MDKELKQNKKIIRKKYFPVSTYIITIILFIIGIILLIDFLGNISDGVSLGHGIVLVCGLMFILIPLYCWVLFILNIVIKPHKEVLVLKKDNEEKNYFVDKNGKEYYYDFEMTNLKEGYYNVLKTKNYIYKVLDKTQEKWTPKEKNEYWTTFYSSEGNFKGIYVLPFVYMILAIGILLFLMSRDYEKVINIPTIIVALSVIIYDLIYKVKGKKSGINITDEVNLKKFSKVIKGIVALIPSGGIAIIITLAFINADGLESKILVSPFLACTYCFAGYSLALIFQNHKLEKFFPELLEIIFFGSWFCALALGTRTLIIEKDWANLLGIIPFWVAGIIVLYGQLIKKTKKKK